MKLEELKPLDLQKCKTVADIVEGMRYCAFGARMLGDVTKSISEEIEHQRKPLIVYDGKEVNGKEIKITPYVNDELKARLGKHVGKYYLFTLSDKIPGEVYQLRSVTPDSQSGGSGKKQPLIEEILTFSPSEKRAAR